MIHSYAVKVAENHIITVFKLLIAFHLIIYVINRPEHMDSTSIIRRMDIIRYSVMMA